MTRSAPSSPHVDCVVQGALRRPLHGLTFAAKDLFDVAGYVTGSGNPDWERTHAPARRHAWAVQALLDAGCTLAGKTITDEISLGLLGRNQFYGTPLNPRAPDRVPGGSSSGSASAVAGGLVDLALGTDSGGSVRTPASFCGLYGLRPTHGRVPVDGMETQSPSFDTCGWFAADAETFARAGEVLLQAPVPATRPAGIVVATDAFALAAPEVRAALAPAVERVAGAFPRRIDRPLAGDEGLAAWYENQRTLQLGEFGRTFRPWVERCVPRFSIEVGRSLTLAMQVTEEDLAGPSGSASRPAQRSTTCWPASGSCACPRCRSCRPGATSPSRRWWPPSAASSSSPASPASRACRRSTCRSPSTRASRSACRLSAGAAPTRSCWAWPGTWSNRPCGSGSIRAAGDVQLPGTSRSRWGGLPEKRRAGPEGPAE